MSETEFLGPATENVMGNMPQADVVTSDNDKALMGIWEKHNGEAALRKDPPMPDVPAGVDSFQATADWLKLPLKERQETSAVHREFASLKKQGEALGMKTETAADMKAIQDMLGGGKEQAAPQVPPAIDPDTQASLETFKAVVPFAKDHKEASTFLNGWVAAIQRNPETGWRQLLEAQGMGHLLRDGAAPPPQAQPEDSGVAAWAAKRGVSAEEQRAMGDIVSEPTWREIAGENINSTLDRAYKALQRRGRLSSEGRVNAELDSTMRGLAADIYRR